MAERYAIRPTSEPLISSIYSQWVNSYRDLPLLINQWANVMRWEKRARMLCSASAGAFRRGLCAPPRNAQTRQRKTPAGGSRRGFEVLGLAFRLRGYQLPYLSGTRWVRKMFPAETVPLVGS